MKKILLTGALFALASPVFAACAITGGACSASIIDTPNLEEKYTPDRLEKIKEPNAFQPRYVTPYYDIMLNTEEPTAQNTAGESQGYNSNCQFGVCLPGVEPDEGTIFD